MFSCGHLATTVETKKVDRKKELEGQWWDSRQVAAYNLVPRTAASPESVQPSPHENYCMARIPPPLKSLMAKELTTWRPCAHWLGRDWRPCSGGRRG